MAAEHSIFVRWIIFLGGSLVIYLALRAVATLILRFLKGISEQPEAVSAVSLPIHTLIITATLHFSLNFVRAPNEAILVNEVSKTLLFLAMVWLAIRMVSALIYATYISQAPDSRMPDLIQKVITGFLYAASGLAILHFYFAVDVTGILVAGAVIAIVGGIAFQDSLRDFFAGITLNLDDTYHIGDMVKVADFVGEVVDTGSRTTKIRSAYNDYVTLPNKAIANAPIINFSSPEDLHRSVVSVPVSISAPPGEVCRILAGSARLARGVLWQNRPVARLKEVHGKHAVYTIEFWIDHYGDNARVEDRILQLCWYRLKRYGFALDSGEPLPLLAKSADNDAQRLRKEESLLLVEGMLLFNTLQMDEMHFLAENARFETREEGEVIFSKGKSGDCFYLITRGVIHILLEGGQEGEVILEGMGPGWSFGELALLTGEPWPYDAVAGTDSELLVLDKEMFQLLLERKPDLAQRLSERVAEVQHRDRNAFRGLQKTVEKTPHSEENLLTRISDFFELV